MRLQPKHLLSILCLFVWLVPLTAHASYFASCELTVVVKKAHKPPTKKHPTAEVLGTKMTFKVVAIGKQSGHSSSHCTHAKMKGKTYTKKVLMSNKTSSLKKLKKGAKLTFVYRYSDGMGRYGVVRSESWQLKIPAKPAKKKKTSGKAR